MRFAFVFDGLGCGGIERVGVDYCNALIECGHEVTVINLVPSMDEFARQLSTNIKYIPMKFSRHIAPERYCSLISRAAWGRFVYPLVYLATSLVVVAKRLCLRNKLGSFDVAIAFSGHFNDLTFVSFGCASAEKKLAWIHGTINSYALISDGYVNLYKHFDKLVCLSDEGIEEFRDAKHWLDLPLVKIHNPIDLCRHGDDGEIKNKLRESYGDYILMVARLAPPKDPETLIDAVAILREKYGIEKKCVIVGDGPDMEKVSKSIAGSSVPDLVHLVGYENNPVPYYQACEVFVLSSLNEGLPTVLLEAMAWGKPVVSTNVPGAREILEGGKDGLLCRIKDPEDMAKCLAFLYSDSTAMTQYSELALSRVQSFSKHKIMDQFLRCIVEGGPDEFILREFSNEP